MKILTWNINGIRATKVPLKQLLDSLDADIICLQETKVTRDMLDERSAIVDGYNSYFSFSNARTGYSGVATYVKDSSTPVNAEQGLSGKLTIDKDTAIGNYGDHTDFTEEELELLDKEGRSIITQHKYVNDSGEEQLLTIVNVYCPRADPEREDRKIFKLRFYELLQIRAEALLKAGSHVIILGDVNTSHRRIDTCDPSEPAEFVKHPGRIWLNQLLWVPEDQVIAEKSEKYKSQTDTSKKEKTKTKAKTEAEEKESSNDDSVVRTPMGCSGGKFIDSFRYFHPHQIEAYTCWNTMKGARETNYGTRIDYIFADKELALSNLRECEIMPEVMGSDHCPVKAGFNLDITAAKKCPPLCTKYFPEFTGVQTKLSSFFTKGTKRTPEEDTLGAGKDGDKLFPSSESVNKVYHIGKNASDPPASKKAKMEKSTLVKKQSSLANFFNAKSTKAGPIDSSQSQPVITKQTLEKTHTSVDTNSLTDLNLTDIANGKGKPQNSSSAWKNLLKGPPPAPLCKGHKEPCVLRTVKKEDSLNKGRQFYVCPRPEGHKSNPQARCDHFEWVDKKKKK